MAGSSIDPSYQFNSVTPSNSLPLTFTDANGVIQKYKTKGVYVGGTGNLAVKNDAGVAVIFSSLAAGVVHPISTDYVMATNTSCTGIVALY